MDALKRLKKRNPLDINRKNPAIRPAVEAKFEKKIPAAKRDARKIPASDRA